MLKVGKRGVSINGVIDANHIFTITLFGLVGIFRGPVRKCAYECIINGLSNAKAEVCLVLFL